jgi:hypothetical protein
MGSVYQDVYAGFAVSRHIRNIRIFTHTNVACIPAHVPAVGMHPMKYRVAFHSQRSRLAAASKVEMGGARAEQRVFQKGEQQIPRNHGFRLVDGFEKSGEHLAPRDIERLLKKDRVDEVSLARGIEGFLGQFR